MMKDWQSIGMYEHPATHRAGTFGKIILSPAGVYCLQVGASIVSCPQDWAAAIHSEETGQTGSIIIRNIPEALRREFKSRCASEGTTQQAKLLELMRKFVK